MHAGILKRLEDTCRCGDAPHLLVHGPRGSGKKTVVKELLKKLYGPGVLRVTHEKRVVQTSSSPKQAVEVGVTISNYHIEIEPSDAGRSDSVVVQDVIKEMANNRPIAAAMSDSSVKHRTIVLRGAGKMTKKAQAGLRRTMEVYSASCRLILISVFPSGVIEPLRSRCVPVRVPRPSANEVAAVVGPLLSAKDEDNKMNKNLLGPIVEASERSLSRATHMAEEGNCHAMFWQEHIQSMASSMFDEQSPRQFMDVRESLKELLAVGVPASVVLKTLVRELITEDRESLDDDVRRQVVRWAAIYDHRLSVGPRSVLHLEAFAATFLDLYRTHTANQFVQASMPMPMPKKSSCETLEQRVAANSSTPCAKTFRPVFPEAMAGYVAPSILLLGMTIIGYGLSTGRGWATSSFIKPSTQLSVMLLLMVADHGSTYWDHSRVSNENYCLTAMLSSKSMDGAKGRLAFGGVGVLLAAASVYGVAHRSTALAATAIPFATMMFYLSWSPQDFQSCKNNALVTGLLAYGLDIMTFIGILETLLSSTGNRDESWRTPTLAYSVVISALFVVLIGWHSDYGDRIKAGSCEIDDEADAKAEIEKDRRPELYTGVVTSVVSIVYFVFLKMKYAEVSCCATYPALIWLAFDTLTKLQVWKRGEPLVGDALHRSVVYIMVQVMDVLLSSSSLIAVMKDRGLLRAPPSTKLGIAGNLRHFVGGSLTYVWSIVRLVGSLVTGGLAPSSSPSSSSGSLKRLAEVVKLVGLNVVANLVPLAIDQKNASYMLTASPQNDLNVKCYVD